MPIILLIFQVLFSSLLQQMPENACGCLCTRMCPSTGAGACIDFEGNNDGGSPPNWLPKYGGLLRDKYDSGLVQFLFQPSVVSGTAYTCRAYDTSKCEAIYSYAVQLNWCPFRSPVPVSPAVMTPTADSRWQFLGCNDTARDCPLIGPYYASDAAVGAALTGGLIPTASSVTAKMRSDPELGAALHAFDAAAAAQGGFKTATPALQAAAAKFIASSLTTTGFDSTVFSRREGLLMGSAAAAPTVLLTDAAFAGNRLYYLLQDCSQFAYAPLMAALVPGGNIT